jgi:hypothetical protein
VTPSHNGLPSTSYLPFWALLAACGAGVASPVVTAPPEQPAPHEAQPTNSATALDVPAGDGWLGCLPTFSCRDTPYRAVYLDAFKLDGAPVATDDYAACVKVGACTSRNLSAHSVANTRTRPERCASDDASQPADCVSWFQAQAFCQWANKRLPTAAEHERAFRTLLASTKEPVGEWVADYHDPAKELRHRSRRSPLGPASGKQRIVRKGAKWSQPLSPEDALPGVGFRCAATNTCAGTQACVHHGRCTLRQASCVAVSADDCKRSDVCRHYGACDAVADRCTGGGVRACLQPCISHGACESKDGQCVVARDSDCAFAEACLRYGACARGPERDRCRPSAPEHCKNSWQCDATGLCSLQDNKCVVGSNADCLSSHMCEHQGYCTKDMGSCRIRSTADCGRSEDCTESGMCHYDGVACTQGSDADCRLSSYCKEGGRCQFDSQKGECAATDATCKTTYACKQSGHCTAKNGYCAIGSAADCAASVVCKQSGLCDMKSNYCAATDDAMCQRSGMCRERGACSLRSASCDVLKDEDCQQSEACKKRGRCFAGGRACNKRR